MSENITSRVGRIVSASFNSIIDTLEDVAPESIMQEAVREIDTAIDDVRVELGRILASKHLSNKRLAEKSTRHDELLGQISIAMKSEREDLARAGVSEQLDIEAQLPVLEQAILDASEKEKELEGYVSALTAKKREMEKDLNDFISSRESSITSDVGYSPKGNGEAVGQKISKATSSFDRILTKHTNVPGDGSFDPENKARVQELEKLTRDHRIEERMAAMKAD